MFPSSFVFTEHQTDLIKSFMNDVAGNTAGNGGAPPLRIEGGAGGYDQRESYGSGGAGGDRDLKPWERQPTGSAAPWQRDRAERANRDDFGGRDHGGPSTRPWASGGRSNDQYGGHGGPPGGAAPWQQQQQPPPPPPGGQAGYGHAGYPGTGYDQNYAAPPSGPPPGVAPWQQFGAPPPPPGDAPPPPPPSGDAPPPPPSDYPPPPPPA